MATVKIDLKDAARHYGKINDAMLRGARRGLVMAAARGVQTIVAQIIPSRSPQPVDRGIYRAGWTSRLVSLNTSIIENPTPQAPLIEYGVRASNVRIGRAMIEALTEWVIRKGIADGSEAKGVAWAIAKSMQRRGIFNMPARRGLRVLEELRKDFLPKFLREEVSREIAREMGGVR